MDTKKINETPILEQATAETNVLVEQNGTASRIPASALGGGGVDEKTIIEKLAPAFTKTGAVVTCNPVEGYPLEVVSRLTNSNPDLLRFAETIIDTNHSLMYIQVNVPAGEYAAWVKGYYDTSVEAYQVETESWVNIGNISIDGDLSEGIEAEGTLTFTHNGGLLRFNGDGVGYSATLKLATDPKAYTSAILLHNGKTIIAEFPQAVSGGNFNWSTGVLSVPAGNPNLITEDILDRSKWFWDENEVFERYNTQDLPAGDYTIYAGNCDISLEGHGIDWLSFGESATFHHDGGVIEIVDINGQGELADWASVKLEAGAEHTEDGFDTFQLTVHEILGLPGVNTLQSTTGDTEVSGTANPAAVFAEQEARIAALEAALSKE